MQRNKRSTLPIAFSSYFKTINRMYETRFSKHNFKKSDGFSKYASQKGFDKLSKLWNSYLTTEQKIQSLLFFLNEG